ncbi:2,3-bisphosphoglycerate-independent phosphoglycerate mutase [Gossypium australe]|uniref:2,3-bisphosphoglycerate-independent phosphoglycerate mutase n=1 Tax=Gossypium australe TaxID=47621 RepID=A0A5B6X2B8_9ROSI|nr:2,3-bisphosphoglycerate-independent phosphoglycerate mutase [Gossypium australe]
MDPDRAVADDIESNAPAPAQGTASAKFRSITSSHEVEAKQAFFQMMNEWFAEFVRTNSAAQQPPPPQVPVAPQVIVPIRLSKPPVDKIRKNGAEEFRATVNDDAERSEFWLENTIRVACKAEEFSKEKKKVDSKARDERKGSMSKSYHSSSKRFRYATSHSNASIGHSSRDRVKQYTSPKAQIPMESSVSSIRNNKPECR